MSDEKKSKNCLEIKIDVVPNIWICNYCGEHLEQPNHMRLNTMCEMLKAFGKSHKNCEKQWKKKNDTV